MHPGRCGKRAATVIAAAVVSMTPARGALGYRPFVSTDAAVADPREVEVEFGYAGFRENRGRVTIVAPTLIGNLGIARDLELVGEFKLANDLTRRRDENATPRRHGAGWVV